MTVANLAGVRPEKTYYVYILECRANTLYCGIAIDVQARFAAHKSGKGARYTRAFPPTRILASVVCGNRSEAQKAEYAIKQLSASSKRAFCKQHGVAP